VFGTHNSDLEDLGLVLGVCAIYPDEFFFFHLCLFVCSFPPFTISSSRTILQYYLQTTAVCFMILPFDTMSCVQLKTVSDRTRKKVSGALLWREAFCACSIHLFPLNLAHCGAVLGPWAWQSVRKLNRLRAQKRLFCSMVCWTWAFHGGL